MVSVNTSEEAKVEIIKQYNKDPKDWKIYISKDKCAHYDIMVMHPSSSWLIKEHEILTKLMIVSHLKN